VFAMKKRLPVGLSDFKEIIKQDMYFVDKSLIIRDLVVDANQVILLTRPRRFGKTLNMKMIKNFFEKTDEDKSYLFKDLEVWKSENVQDHFSKYPVIYITFKDIKNMTWNDCYLKIAKLIQMEYDRNRHLLNSDILTDVE
jgi:hypothetical protein